MEEQDEAIREYCAKEGMELLQIYEDAAISGAKADEDELVIERPGIQDLLADLKGSGVKYVVVLTTNRLWRSDIVKVLIHRELKRHQVDVRAVDRPTYSIYDKDPTSFLLNGMMELLDSYERLEISLKLRRGRVRKATKGGYAGGGAAIGYTARKGQKRLAIDEKKAATVRRTFALRDENPEWTLGRIAEQLNAENHRTARGALFSKTTVWRILHRKAFYAGLYQYGDVSADGQHEKIL
jgi:DNA invertase Pin-like site-specific DNA recombinase